MSAAAQRVGVFGGAFDPPHVAHRSLVETALRQLQLDLLYVFPTGHAWHKPRQLSATGHRVAMAALAFADLPKVRVDTRETQRIGPSYTIDTLVELRAEHPDATLFLLIGQDQAQSLQSWREWDKVVQLAVICVAARVGNTGDLPAFAPPGGLAQRFLQLEFPQTPVSATTIRSLAGAGQPVSPLVCDAVARYIADHHLYQSA